MTEIWREKRVLLAVLAGLLVINGIFFLTYRVRYEQRVRDLDAKLGQTAHRLEEAQTRRLVAEKQMVQYREIVSNIQTIYNEWWSTPELRLTSVIRELRSMGKTSQLDPKAVSYSLADMKKEIAAAESLTIGFSVTGPYRNVRQLINLIELSRQFVTIDSIALSEEASTPENVSLSIQLKTIFRSDPAAGRT